MEAYVDKFKGLSLGEKIIPIAALVLFIAGFLPWYSVNLGSVGGVDFGSVHRSGWQSPGAMWSILAILIGLVMAGVVLVKAFAKEGTLPDNVGGITWPRIHLGAAGVAALFIIIKLLDESSNMGFGFFLGIICVAALVVAGALMFREEQAKAV